MTGVCCDPCSDPNAVTHRSGPAIEHLTNWWAGDTWTYTRQFFWPLEDQPGVPDPDNPVDFGDSTWTLELWPIGATDGEPAFTFDFDLADQDQGIIAAVVSAPTDNADTSDDCLPTYVHRLRQTRDDKTVTVAAGDIIVVGLSSLSLV